MESSFYGLKYLAVKNLHTQFDQNFELYTQSLQHCQLTWCSMTKSREASYNIVVQFLLVDEVCLQFGSYVKPLCHT